MFCTLTQISLIAFAMLVGGGCVHSQTRDATQTDAREAPRTTHAKGSIEGGIAHPAHVIPSMRICAISSRAAESDERQAKYVCVRTRSNQSTYRIDGLPADDYIVIAQTDSTWFTRPLGYLQQVQCIRAPCPALPATVSVGEGAHVTGIRLTPFQGNREDFPVLPNE